VGISVVMLPSQHPAPQLVTHALLVVPPSGSSTTLGRAPNLIELIQPCEPLGTLRPTNQRHDRYTGPQTLSLKLSKTSTYLLCACQCCHQSHQSCATAQLKHLLTLENLRVGKQLPAQHTAHTCGVYGRKYPLMISYVVVHYNQDKPDTDMTCAHSSWGKDKGQRKLSVCALLATAQNQHGASCNPAAAYQSACTLVICSLISNVPPKHVGCAQTGYAREGGNKIGLGNLSDLVQQHLQLLSSTQCGSTP
jgi:hypothetical protein